MKRVIIIAVFAGSAFAAKHYAYAGRDPARWTVSDSPPDPAAAASEYSSYIADSYDYQVARLVTDSSGNTFIAGSRLIPSQQAFLTDVFVTRLDSAGKILFTATIGGKGTDQALDLALDPAGNIYIAGQTSSPNFPLRNALQPQPGPAGSGFIVKLSPDGSRLLYSTYFGGRASRASAIAADADGNMYVAGSTHELAFTSTAGLPSDRPSFGVAAHGPAFVAKISAAGDRILWAGLLGGDQVACGGGSSCFLSERNTGANGIALDGAGNVYIAGNSNVTDLPATPGAMVWKGGIGGFVAKVNADGRGMGYLTYIGTTNFSVGAFSNLANKISALSVDGAGNAYLAGSTTDPKFPATAGALQATYAGPSQFGPDSLPDAFVAKLKPDGTVMVWATYLGGTAADMANSIAIDAAGNAWVAGTTASPEFPNANGWTNGRDFLVGLNATGSALTYSARFPDGSAARSVAVDSGGTVHIAGSGGIVSTISTSPAPRIFGIANSAWGDVAGRIAPGELISIYGPHIGPATPASFSLDSSGLVPKTLAGVQVSVGGLAAPLLYVSDAQINAIVPMGVNGDSTTVRVSNASTSTPEFRAMVAATAPQIFRKAEGSAAAVNEDGTLNSASNPAKVGSVVAVWATGTGAVRAADGAIQTADNNFCCQVFSGVQRLEVLYAGAAPGLVAGVSQINFRVPVPLPLMFVDTIGIQIQAGAKTSETAAIYFKR